MARPAGSCTLSRGYRWIHRSAPDKAWQMLYSFTVIFFSFLFFFFSLWQCTLPTWQHKALELCYFLLPPCLVFSWFSQMVQKLNKPGSVVAGQGGRESFAWQKPKSFYTRVTSKQCACLCKSSVWCDMKREVGCRGFFFLSPHALSVQRFTERLLTLFHPVITRNPHCHKHLWKSSMQLKWRIRGVLLQVYCI